LTNRHVHIYIYIYAAKYKRVIITDR